jgi:hypothetical protein
MSLYEEIMGLRTPDGTPVWSENAENHVGSFPHVLKRAQQPGGEPLDVFLYMENAGQTVREKLIASMSPELTTKVQAFLANDPSVRAYVRARATEQAETAKTPADVFNNESSVKVTRSLREAKNRRDDPGYEPTTGKCAQRSAAMAATVTVAALGVSAVAGPATAVVSTPVVAYAAYKIIMKRVGFAQTLSDIGGLVAHAATGIAQFARGRDTGERRSYEQQAEEPAHEKAEQPRTHMADEKMTAEHAPSIAQKKPEPEVNRTVRDSRNNARARGENPSYERRKGLTGKQVGSMAAVAVVGAYGVAMGTAAAPVLAASLIGYAAYKILVKKQSAVGAGADLLTSIGRVSKGAAAGTWTVTKLVLGKATEKGERQRSSMKGQTKHVTEREQRNREHDLYADGNRRNAGDSNHSREPAGY